MFPKITISFVASFLPLPTISIRFLCLPVKFARSQALVDMFSNAHTCVMVYFTPSSGAPTSGLNNFLAPQAMELTQP